MSHIQWRVTEVESTAMGGQAEGYPFRIRWFRTDDNGRLAYVVMRGSKFLTPSTPSEATWEWRVSSDHAKEFGSVEEAQAALENIFGP